MPKEQTYRIHGYLPLNGAEIVIRKPKVEEADASAGEAA
jgi:hypothetical protein